MLGNYIVIKRASGEFEDQNLKSNTGLLVYLVVIFSALLLASMTWNVGCNGELTPMLSSSCPLAVMDQVTLEVQE